MAKPKFWITAEKLEVKEACKDDLDKFRKEWPEGCSPNLANLKRAVQLGLDLEWFAVMFLPDGEEYEAFDAEVDKAYHGTYEVTDRLHKLHNRGRIDWMEYRRRVAVAYRARDMKVAKIVRKYIAKAEDLDWGPVPEDEERGILEI